MRFGAEYQQTPPDQGEAHAYELFAWYYDETETYDRSIGCPVHPDLGFSLPQTAEQRRLSTQHAHWLLGEVTRWALQLVNADTARLSMIRACARDEARSRPRR